ncbi:unnamed protein product [Porites lobata]|uniref:Uncharacterized protein n=1 Tax=Porites lobata TaxID=104759 RepID=A0ABN8NFQ5_9CNID|nr:unnamed protein product [Porites lobata]
MEGFDPSALLAKPSTNGTSSAISSDGRVTTVNVKSSEELVNEEETEERKETTTRQGSEKSSSQSSAGEISSSQVELNQNSKPPSRHSSCLSLDSAKVHPEVSSENSAPTPVERPSTSDFIVSDSAESQVKAHKVRYQRTGYTPCRVTQVFWAEVITFHMHTTQTANGTVIMTVAVRNVTIQSFKRTRPTCYSINRTI